MSEELEESLEQSKTSRASQLKRFFSLESTGTDSIRYANCPDLEEDGQKGARDLGLKLSQLFLGVLCIGMYSAGIPIVKCNELRLTSLIFPSVVFGASLIVTGVVCLSYALRHFVSESMVRIFAAIFTILYLASAIVSGHIWYAQLYGKMVNSNLAGYAMFCAQIATSLLNAVLYGVDVGLSVRRAWNVK